MPEAGMITTAQIADLRNPSVLAQLSLLERETGQIPMHPAVFWSIFGPDLATETVNIPSVGLGGRDPLEQVADGEDFARTALTTDSVSISPGRFGKKYGATDLVRSTDGQRIFNAGVMATDAIAAKAQAVLGLGSGVVDDYTSTAGTPGAVFTIPQYQAGIYTLNARNVSGAKLAMLASIQWKHLQDYMTANAGGALQFTPAAARVIELSGGGAMGNLLGADVFVHNRAPSKNSGTDVGGGVFGFGGLAIGEWTFVDDGDPNQALLSPVSVNGQTLYTLSVERDRDPGAGTTDWVMTALLGCSKGRDTCGVSFITRAT